MVRIRRWDPVEYGAIALERDYYSFEGPEFFPLRVGCYERATLSPESFWLLSCFTSLFNILTMMPSAMPSCHQGDLPRLLADRATQSSTLILPDSLVYKAASSDTSLDQRIQDKQSPCGSDTSAWVGKYSQIKHSKIPNPQAVERNLACSCTLVPALSLQLLGPHLFFYTGQFYVNYRQVNVIWKRGNLN